jgi:cytochrome bd ubiquinol oxidase subunit II
MSFHWDLPSIWFLLVGVLLMGYAVLDGFDLGIGALHLLARRDEDRRVLVNAIGPVWDGNEVWLVTGGGALFAAFPDVYATVFSGFYVAFMLFLLALIFRAVSLEFRSKLEHAGWRRAWDVAFSLSSIVAALLLGVALGNVIRGVPLDPDKEFVGSFLGLLNPYALLVGLTTLALFTLHGALYAVMKTEGALQAQARDWVRGALVAFGLLYVTTTMATLLFVPHLVAPYHQSRWLLVFPFAVLLAAADIPRELHRGREGRAFLSSAIVTVGLLSLVGIGMYPHLVWSLPHPELGLTIYNAASSPKTLRIMLIIALVGMPLVIGYTIAIYRVFRGKVRLGPHSY